MNRGIVGLSIILVLGMGGCASSTAQRRPLVAPEGGWQLMQPPEVADARYPHGYRVQADAPLTAWAEHAVFETRDRCEQSKIVRIDDAIDRARAKVGENAKYELTVRRAVNARCVPVQSRTE